MERQLIAYNSETIVQRGYWMVNWFKREFGLREQRIAGECGVEVESLFDDLIREVPPGSMGAAINAAVRVGLYPSYQAAIDHMTHEGDRFTPIVENVRIYDQLYNEVYLKMYDRLSPLYGSIREITDYPF